jgi:hypothetical protein
MRKELHRSRQMHARLQPLCISRVCGAPFPVAAAMLVDAARPHPGCSWRASVPTGLAEEIGSGVEEPTLARP